MKRHGLLNDIMVTTPHEAVKAVGKGVVSGMLVRFSDAEDTDLTKEYFTKSTNFAVDFPFKSRVYFDHGLDPNFGKKSFGVGQASYDEETGVSIKATLDMDDRDAVKVFKMAENGELGWSSGTAAHLIVRTAVKTVPGVREIQQWPLGVDASLTPVPADPKNVAYVKSLSMLLEEGEFKSMLVNNFDGEIESLEDLLDRVVEVKSLRGDEFKSTDQYRWRVSRILDLAKSLQAELTPLPDDVVDLSKGVDSLCTSLAGHYASMRQPLTPY